MAIISLGAFMGGVLDGFRKQLRRVVDNHLDIAILGEHAGERFAEEAVLRGYEDARLGQFARSGVAVCAVRGSSTVCMPIGGCARVAVAMRAGGAIKTREPIATGPYGGPEALLDLQTPPRSRAHDGILSEDGFLAGAAL